MATVLAGAICTKAADCKAASSCCMAVRPKTNATSILASPLVCVAAGTKILGAVTVPTGTKGLEWNTVTGAAGQAFASVACAAAAAGASNLVVSAAAAATAVYMM